MNKANKIYLERLRKNDFIQRYGQPLLINGIPLSEYGSHLKIITYQLQEYFVEKKNKKPNPFNFQFNGL